jgi:hypothetical protein
MAKFNHYPLQAAIYQALTSNAPLMALITGVYDRPPQGSIMPYVTIGEFDGKDASTKTTSAIEYTLPLYVWSRQGGRKEIAIIMESLHTVLHQAPLVITGQTLVMMRYALSEITLEDDGVTYMGVMKFYAYVEAN